MSMFDLYVLFVLLPAINGFVIPATICLISSILIGVIVWIIGVVENEPPAIAFGKLLLKTVAVPALVIALLSSLAPTGKQVPVIVGGYVATNIEGVEKLPESMVKAVDSYLQQFNTDAKE